MLLLHLLSSLEACCDAIYSNFKKSLALMTQPIVCGCCPEKEGNEPSSSTAEDTNMTDSHMQCSENIHSVSILLFTCVIKYSCSVVKSDVTMFTVDI